MGSIPLGGAVVTGPGRLPYQAIIHVAGINLLWRSSERSIRGSVRNAMAIVGERGWASVAFPIVGAGSGGFDQDGALALMKDELGRLSFAAEVVIVRFRKR